MSKIHLISGPRNISTAMMYSFARRPVCKVVDEPFYAYYLNRTGLNHPGRAAVLESMSSDPVEIQKQLSQLFQAYPEVFIKNMSHHLEGIESADFFDWKNIWLVRNPEKMIVSFSKVIDQPTLQDLGLQQQWSRVEEYRSKTKNDPVVVDADTFLENPARGLQRLCAQIDIAYKKEMLNWPKGPIPEDGVWAKYWYKNVHASEGFRKGVTDASNKVSPSQNRLLDEAMHYYHKLKQFEVK